MRFYEAEALAAHAANDLNSSSSLSARAAFVAGERAAHIASPGSGEARGYFERAQSLASDETLGWRATLGAVVAAIELEDPLVEDLLNSLGPGRHWTRQPKLPSQIATWHTRLASVGPWIYIEAGQLRSSCGSCETPSPERGFRTCSDTRLRPLRTGTRQQRLRMSNSEMSSVAGLTLLCHTRGCFTPWWRLDAGTMTAAHPN